MKNKRRIEKEELPKKIKNTKEGEVAGEHSRVTRIYAGLSAAYRHDSDLSHVPSFLGNVWMSSVLIRGYSACLSTLVLYFLMNALIHQHFQLLFLDFSQEIYLPCPSFFIATSQGPVEFAVQLCPEYTGRCQTLPTAYTIQKHPLAFVP